MGIEVYHRSHNSISLAISSLAGILFLWAAWFLAPELSSNGMVAYTTMVFMTIMVIPFAIHAFVKAILSGDIFYRSK